MSRTLVMGLLFLTSSACMQRRSPQELQAKNPWLGRSLDELVATEGYPVRRHTSPKGNEVYEYRSTTRRPATEDGKVTFSSLYRDDQDIVSQECVQWFEIQDKKILSVQTKGC